MNRLLQRDIVDILISDTRMFPDRRRFYESLNPLDPDFEQLNTQLNNGTINLHEFCTQSLCKWVAHNGSGATVEKLIEIMEVNGFQLIADNIAGATSRTLSGDNLFEIVCWAMAQLIVGLLFTELLGVATVDRVNVKDKIPDGFPTSTEYNFFEIDSPTKTFVGRLKELDQLEDLFNNPSTVFVKLIGMGGVGKSELAKSFANSLKDEDAVHISTLCNLLHNFPLALQQAIAYINQQKLIGLLGEAYSIQNYLDEYKSQHSKLFNFPLSEIDHDYNLTTLVTWTISINQIKNSGTSGDLAIVLLNLMAYFEADGITIDFICRISKDDKESEELNAKNVKAAVMLLKMYSLVKSKHNVISIHRLIQQVSRVNLESSKLEVEILTKCLISIDDIDAILTRNDMPHVLSVWKYSTKYKYLIIIFPNLSCKIANKLKNLSLYRELLDFASESYNKLNTVFGDKHIETLTMESHVASALTLNGKYSDALEKFEIVLQKMKSHLGEEDGETLVAVHNMASTLSDLERYDEAMELLQTVFEAEKRVLGETHPSTMNTKHDIALVLMAQGKNEEAMKIYEYLLEWRMAEFGEEHPHTLTTKHSIATCLILQEEYEKAKTLFQQVLEMEVKVLGEEHPETLNSKYMLGLTLYKMGESEKGLKMLKEVLISREKVLGPQHPDTIITRDWIDLIIKETQGIYQ